MKRLVNSAVIIMFSIILVSCAAPPAAPTNPITSTPPPIPPPASSPEGSDFTATPGPPVDIPTRTIQVSATPPPPSGPIVTPGFDWGGPAIVYNGLNLSSFDGLQKRVIPVEVPISPWYSDYSREAGRIVTTADSSLWILDVRTGLQRELSLKGSPDWLIESPVISTDGARIAYSLVRGFGEDDIQQLWKINADGSENELVIENTGQHITDPGPFRLIPAAWSADNSRVYMVTTTDSEASPVGMYVADLIAGTIEKARTPQVTLWDVSFSPDRARIAYRTFKWVPVEGSMPQIGPPFTLQVTDLASGVTRILQESDTLAYYDPVWSEDGNQIAYAVRSHRTGADVGLFSIDLTATAIVRWVAGSEGRTLRPCLWLSDDRLAFTEEDVSSGSSLRKTLYTIRRDGTDKYEIDAASCAIVMGILDN